MAWGSVGSLGTVGSATVNQTSLVLTTTATLEAGNVGVLIISVDNNQTTDGDEGAVSGVQDSAGNIWSKGREYTNGQGGAQAGVTVSLWFVKATTQLTSGGTITASFTNSASRDASAASAWEFTVSAGATVSVDGGADLAEDAISNPGSLDVTTANAERLRIRAVAEENNGATMTATAGWTKFTDERSTGGGASNTKVAIHGEFQIVTGTNAASDPSGLAANADLASVYVALKAVTAYTRSVSATRAPSPTIVRQEGSKRTASATRAPAPAMTRVKGWTRTTSVTVAPSATMVRREGWKRTASATRAPAPATARIHSNRRALALGGPVVLDNYTDPDGTSLDQHRPDAGPLWTEAEGTWEIQGNQAALAIADGAFGQNQAVIELGVADASVRCTLVAPNADFNAGLIANYTDDNNHWQVQVSTGGLIIWECTDGLFTLQGFAGGLANNATYEVRVLTAGDTISLYVGETLMLSYTGAPRVNKAGTKFGIRAHSSSDLGVRFDHFMGGPSYAILAPAPTVARLFGIKRTRSVTRAPSPTVVRRAVLGRLLSITRAVSPTVARRLTYLRPSSVTRAVSPTVARQAVMVRARSVTRAVSPVVARVLGAKRTRTVTRAVSPTLARAVAFLRSFSVTRAVSPTVTGQVTTGQEQFQRALAVTRAVSQALTRQLTMSRAVLVTRAVSETLARRVATRRAATVTSSPSPVTTRRVSLGRRLTVTRSPDANASFLAPILRPLSVTRPVTVTLARQVALGRRLASTRAPAPTTRRSTAVRRTATATVAPSPTVTQRRALVRALLVTIQPVATALRQLVLGRRLTVVRGVLVSLVRRVRYHFIEGNVFHVQPRHEELAVQPSPTDFAVPSNTGEFDVRPADDDMDVQP